jgi:enolase-phosphatase E1
MIKLHLFDIEGTTTDINFVHKELFPYSAKALGPYILDHQSQLQTSINQVRETVASEEGRRITLEEVIAQLHQWIIQDRKHPALKEIQGLIWEDGYKGGHFKGHLYSDVEPFFRRIINSGGQIGIYSSGSVHAQKLLFGHSVAGDLTPMISFYFDTRVGGKRVSSSYSEISRLTKIPPENICFYSDIPEELQAAHESGLEVIQLLRDAQRPSRFQAIQNFEAL